MQSNKYILYILSLSLPTASRSALSSMRYTHKGNESRNFHPCWRSCETTAGPKMEENSWQAHSARLDAASWWILRFPRAQLQHNLHTRWRDGDYFLEGKWQTGELPEQATLSWDHMLKRGQASWEEGTARTKALRWEWGGGEESCSD